MARAAASSNDAVTTLPAREASREAGPLGENLRRIRTGRGLSLAEVSERTSLAHSSLWKVENHQMSLTYDKLALLAQGLGVGVAELFAQDAPRLKPGCLAVSRRGEGPSQNTRYADYIYPCTELRDRRMTPMVTDLTCTTLEAFGPWSRHEGEEYVFVVQGPVVFASEFYSPLTLEAGDSLYYDSGMGHAFLKGGDGRAQILSVCAGVVRDPLAAEASSSTRRAAPVQTGRGAASGSRGQNGARRRR